MGKFSRLKENSKLFLKALVGDIKIKGTERIRKEAYDEMDNFMLLCFGDLIGIPMTTSYYTLELLPFLAEDLENWEKRILRRESVVADRWGDFCC